MIERNMPYLLGRRHSFSLLQPKKIRFKHLCILKLLRKKTDKHANKKYMQCIERDSDTKQPSDPKNQTQSHPCHHLRLKLHFTVERGWRSGESTRLPQMRLWFDSRSRCHMRAEFVVGSRPCTERVFMQLNAI